MKAPSLERGLPQRESLMFVSQSWNLNLESLLQNFNYCKVYHGLNGNLYYSYHLNEH